MKQVTIYTDGACSGNPGPGGWGAILEWNGVDKELSGGEAQTTNNRMELTGVIRALSALKEPCEVDLYTDSKYVLDALTKGWAKSWRARLGEGRQKTGPQSRPVADPAGTDGAAYHALPLGQGPRGQSQEQPLRPDGRGREPEVQVKADVS